MKQRPSTSSSTNPKNASRQDIARPGLTRQQRLVLILVGLLVTAWAILGVVFLLSLLESPPGQALATTDTPQATLAQPTIAETVAPAKPPAISIPVACAQNNSGASQGTARAAGDGTVKIISNNQATRIRLAGILLQGEGELKNQGVQAIRSLIDGKTVTLARDPAEQDGSIPLARYVFSGDTFVNYELVRQGLATVDPDSPDQACASLLKQAEQQARTARLGLWNPTAVPTRTFMPLVTLDLSTQTACDCSHKYVCSDFKTHAQAQTCFNACNDYSSKLDPNHDGIACEELP
jgi:endonuclease YncB( thermonuclease family)